MAALSVDARKLTHAITFKVTGLRSVGIRMKIAAMMFHAGARIAGVQIDIEMSRISVGDVVTDRYDGKRVTVERIEGKRADVVWFEGSTLHRGSLLLRNLKPDHI